MPEGFFDVVAKLNAKKASAKIVKPPADASKSLTVSELTAIIDSAIKTGVPASVAVRGEISNANLHRASGHLYFTLKDANACIDCVMFRDSASRLKFTVTDGIEMIATGRVGVYPSRGRYQLYASTLQPIGQGALELAFRQLQAKLAAEGLFAIERKKPIPLYPMRIALVTSQSTAALQDMLKILRRFSWLRLMIYHVPVQGEGSAAKIAGAISHLNQSANRFDVILLARGGGSLEDLWPFNEEAVARAIFSSTIPIVTGIGHEVDCSIADLTSDHHAHTPTEAAQVVTANWKDVAEAIDLLGLRLRRGAHQALTDARTRLQSIERHETFRRPMDRVDTLRQLLDDKQRSITLAITQKLQSLHRRILANDAKLQSHGPAAQIREHRQRLSDLGNRLNIVMQENLRSAESRLSQSNGRLQERHPRHQINLSRQLLSSQQFRLNATIRQTLKRTETTIEALSKQLRALGPEQVLKRGYTITHQKKTGALIRSISQIKPGDRLITRMADGQAESIAEDQRQMSLFE